MLGSLSRYLPALVAAALVLGACSAPLTRSSASPTTRSTEQSLSGTLTSGAGWKIEVPPRWNGTLVLYSHGYVLPVGGQANPAVAVPGTDGATWMAGHGYAVAGSSYASTGWALEDAFRDQIALLDLFSERVGQPKRTIAWGHSLGGIITAGLVELHPERFAGALPMCGVLAGGVGTWNQALDAAFSFQTLLAPAGSALQVAGYDSASGIANLQLASQLLSAAAGTQVGQARLALVFALGDTPGWFDPASPEPGPTEYAAQQAAQGQWASRVTFPFVFLLRADLERRAGGNPSWNVGVDYRKQLALSADEAEVRALYSAAGLSLESDLDRLNSAPRIAADPAAVDYLRRNIVFDGDLKVPVLTLHTSGDGLVPPENERAYADVIAASGHSDQLRQLFVHRAGHCSFTAAEQIAAFQALVRRLDTGRWEDTALSATAMNASAMAEGTRYNELGSQFRPTPPAFFAYQPPAFMRPFDTRSTLP